MIGSPTTGIRDKIAQMAGLRALFGRLLNGALRPLGVRLVRLAPRPQANGRFNSGGHKGDAAANTALDGGAGLRLLPAVNQAPEISSRPSPISDERPDAGALSSYAREFQASGIVAIEAYPGLAARWRRQLSFDSDVGNRYPSWDWAGNPIAPYSGVMRSAKPTTDMVEDLRKLLSSKEFDSFFRAILGCPVFVANFRLFKSVAHCDDPVGPQSWHVDSSPAGVLRGLIYLSDVTLQSGPFQFIDTEGKERSMVAGAGTMLLFDANRLQHRAAPPEAHERIVADLIFLPRLPGMKMKVMVAGMNSWPADPYCVEEPQEYPT